MTDFTLTLDIKKVGDKEAYDSLALLDKKGRQVVDDAAGAMGKAMGDVASTYTRGSNQVRAAIERVAEGHRQTIAEIEAQTKAADRAAFSQEKVIDRLERRQGSATLTAARGLEQIARSGRAVGSGLDTVLAQVSQVAFGFGVAGPIVGAIGVATIAIVEMFARAAKEAKKLADDMAKEFERISDMSVKAQGEQAAQLFSGKWNAADPLDRLGIKGLRQQQAALEARVRAGTSETIQGGSGGMSRIKVMTEDAQAASDLLDKVKGKLAQIVPLWQSITGRGGSIERAGTEEAAAALPGERTRAQAAAAALDRAQNQQALQAKLGDYNAYIRKQAEEYRRASAETVREFEHAQDLETSIAITQYNEQAREAKRAYKEITDETIKEAGLSRSRSSGMDLAQLREAITKTVAEGGVFMQDAIDALAEHMRASLSKILGDGIVSGLESAFSGKGIGGSFESLTATVLAGLGGFMEALGAQMIVIGVGLQAFAEAMLRLDGFSAVAIGVALIAAGAGLKAIASSFGKGTSPSGASSGGSTAAPSFLTFGVQASGSAPTTSQRAPTARPSINLTVIGDGPGIQRELAQIINSADERDLLKFRARR